MIRKISIHIYIDVYKPELNSGEASETIVQGTELGTLK